MDNKNQLDVKITKATEEDIADNKPLSLGGYLSLPLSEEDIDLHTSNICKRIDEIIEDADRKDLMELAQSWRNQYLGLVAETNFPWSGAFNLDMRLTPKIQDAVVSQTEEAFDDADPHWAIGPVTNKEMMEVRDKQEKVLDAYEDTEINNKEDIESIRHDAFLLGTGWEATLFERKLERVRDFKVYNNLEKFMADYPNDFHKYPNYINDLQMGMEVKIIVEYNREVRRSPIRKHIEFEDAICPLDAKGVEGVNNTDIRGRRVWMKYWQIKQFEDEGDYIKGCSERLKYQPALDRDGRLVDDPDYLNKDYETFEMIYDMYIKINGKERRVRTLWNIEKEHKVCLRCIRYPYDHNRSYLIPHNIKFTNKGLYQDGMGRMLQDIHIAGNATINHILNSATLANSLSLKAREGSDAARRLLEHRWFPGSVLELQNMDDAQQFNFATPNLASLISLFGIIEKFASDVSGIVNYSVGQESQEDPSAPASKTFALMRKAENKLRRYIKNLKRSEDEAGYQALRLIYQYIPMERLNQIVGQDISITDNFMQPPLRVITNASGFAIEKIFAKQDNMNMGGLLMKTPFLQDPVAQSKLIYTIAEDYGSNWDKKIIGIVPTADEIKQKQEEVKQIAMNKRLEVGKQATQQALDGGAMEEEARAVGMDAMKKYDTMLANQQMIQQQGGQNKPVQ